MTVVHKELIIMYNKYIYVYLESPKGFDNEIKNNGTQQR